MVGDTIAPIEILPNAPQLIASAKLAPALVAGCTVVLKPAPETPLSRVVPGEHVYALVEAMPA